MLGLQQGFNMSKTITYAEYLELKEGKKLPLPFSKAPGNKKKLDTLSYTPDMYSSSGVNATSTHKEYLDTGTLKDINPLYDSYAQPIVQRANPKLDKYYSFGKLGKCCETHKPLKIIVDGKEYLIYGGSCSAPIIHDADIYIGFEKYMYETKQSYPWNGGASFCFYIQDRGVPTSIEDTKNLLVYLATNLINGKKIHIGCIGGHGRTGTILAALVTYMTGNVDSIEYVRANYCAKAVESQLQIEWLHSNFGITKSKALKLDYITPVKSSGSTFKGFASNKKEVGSKGFYLLDTVRPVKVKGSVWGF